MSNKQQKNQKPKDDMLLATFKRGEYYRKNLRTAIYVSLVAILANVTLVILLVLLNLRGTEIRMVAVTDSGELIQLQSRDRVDYTQNQVLNWATLIIPKLYALDFANYRVQLQAQQRYFFPQAWQSYREEFEPTLNKIKKEKLVLSAAVNGTPVMMGVNLDKQTPMWKLQIPVIMSFQKGEHVSSASYILEMVVQKDPGNNKLRILQVIATPRK